nr:leucine-rich repeat protein [uncultured Oscillibacter sp.]
MEQGAGLRHGDFRPGPGVEHVVRLSSATLPDTVTSIGNWAFDGCSSFTRINIPPSAASIKAGASFTMPAGQLSSPYPCHPPAASPSWSGEEHV